MTGNTETNKATLSQDTRRELENLRGRYQADLAEYAREIERLKAIIDNINGTLNLFPDGQQGEIPAMPSPVAPKTAQSPTDFVRNTFRGAPNTWFSIDEMMFRAKAAQETGLLVVKSGTVEAAIHSVLRRFRVSDETLSKGKRFSRKYKLKT